MKVKAKITVYITYRVFDLIHICQLIYCSTAEIAFETSGCGGNSAERSLLLLLSALLNIALRFHSYLHKRRSLYIKVASNDS